MNQQTKRCIRCGEEKPVTEFYACSRPYKDGTIRYDSLCKACRYAANDINRKKQMKIGVFRSKRDGHLRVYGGKPGTPPLLWTEDMLSIMRRYYPNTSDKEVGEMIGLSSKAVYLKAKKMGLKKSAAYLRSYRSTTAKIHIRLYNQRRKNQSQPTSVNNIKP